MFAAEGPSQAVFGDGTIIRKAVDWNKNLIPGLLVTGAGEFYVKTTHWSSECHDKKKKHMCSVTHRDANAQPSLSEHLLSWRMYVLFIATFSIAEMVFASTSLWTT